MKSFSILICSLFICFSILLFSCSSVSNENLKKDLSAIPAKPDFNKLDFVKVSGNKLVDSHGKDFFIKGMAFGNQVWSNTPVAPNFHHTKDSYTELAEMGFNSVRFYINYQLFESDNAPGKYKKNGFEWLNKNIQWAEAAGIKLIVNMHVPQGGFQSNGEGLSLFYDRQNQVRLINLWQTIAEYYKDCSTIIGWGLVNEPNVPFKGDSKTSLNAWNNLANEITNAIREVDKNHVIFVESAIAVIDFVNGQKKWYDFNPEDSFPMIEDDNLVYEIHSYEPMEFTHQGATWVESCVNIESSYPNEDYLKITYKEWVAEKQKYFSETKSKYSSNWSFYEYEISSDEIKENAQIFNFSVKPRNLGENGAMFIDDVKVIKINKDNLDKQEVIFQYDFNKDSTLWGFGSGDNSGLVSIDQKSGRNSSGCLKIESTTSWAWCTSPSSYVLEDNCIYQVQFWAKFKNVDDSCNSSFGIDIAQADVEKGYGKEKLRKSIERRISFLEKYNKPIFIGEFGCIRNCFSKNLGADAYIKDSIDIFKELSCGYNYHTYHEYSFGLYFSDPAKKAPLKVDLNAELKELFINLQN